MCFFFFCSVRKSSTLCSTQTTKPEVLAEKVIIHMCNKIPRWFFSLEKYEEHCLTSLQLRCLKWNFNYSFFQTVPSCKSFLPQWMVPWFTQKVTQCKNLGMILNSFLFFTFCIDCIIGSSGISSLSLSLSHHIYNVSLHLHCHHLSHYHFSFALLEQPSIYTTIFSFNCFLLHLR